MAAGGWHLSSERRCTSPVPPVHCGTLLASHVVLLATNHPAARHLSQQGISRSKASLRTNASLAATHHSQLGCEESKRWLFMWWSKRTACGCPCGRMRPWCALMLMALSSASDASQHPTRSMSRHAEGCVPSMRRVIRAATLGDHLVSDHLVNDHLMGDQLKR